MNDHTPSCPRSQFWDAGEFQAPCTCDEERCFACDKPLTAGYRVADTRDDQIVRVGPDCYRQVEKAGDAGYQPRRGGPRLYLVQVSP